MTDGEFRARLDAHMERGNEVIAQCRDEFRLNREEFRLNREEFRLNREEHQLNRESHAKILADWREYTRTMMLRVERIGREELKQLAALREESREVRDESRAQTQALLRMIDRMNRLDPPPAGA